jgi:phage/plasmid-like protein (TIGR03299 family)
MTTDQQFSTREVPWMKIGRIEAQPKTAKEAAELSGLNFTVSLRDVGIIISDDTDPTYMKVFPNSAHIGKFWKISNRKAVVADDNGDFMGFVSNTAYHSLQYGEAFDFMDALGQPYVAAGALRGRRQGFMVVKPAIEAMVIGGEDPHDVFAILRTSHDCSRAVEVSVMMLRGRCMNQLTLRSFSKDATYRWSIKHTSTMKAKLEEAQASLKNIGLYVKRFEQLAEQLSEKTVSPAKAREVLKIVIPRPAGKTEKIQLQWEDRLATIMSLWQSSPTVAYAGTAWGLVNAVSEYMDWYRPGGSPESRFINALEGETHKRINKTAGLLLSNA